MACKTRCWVGEQDSDARVLIVLDEANQPIGLGSQEFRQQAENSRGSVDLADSLGAPVAGEREDHATGYLGAEIPAARGRAIAGRPLEDRGMTDECA